MEYENYNSENELTHWGIKGMRWGVRRYQNKDGSLTAAGKKRLKAESDALKKEEQVLKNRKATAAKINRLANKRKALEDQKKELDDADGKTKNSKSSSTESAKTARKSVSEMTDAELNAAVNRGRLEEAYRQLYPEPPVKKSFMKTVVDDVVAPAALNSGKKLLENALNKAGENLLKGKVDPNSLEALKKTYEKLDYQQKIDKILNPDKYLSEEDKNKRQSREFDAADRASKMKGYKDAADEAQARRDALSNAKKAAADEAARVANEAKSREYYNSVYNKNTGERTTVSSATNTVVQKLLGGGTTTTALATTGNVSSGKSHITALLEGSAGNRKTNEIGYVDEDGRFHAY